MARSPEVYDRNHEDNAENWRKKMLGGENARSGTDNMSEDGKEKQVDLIEGLKEYSKKTGVDVSRFIKQLENARRDSEVHEVEEKMKRVATKWYATQLQRSGAYEADDHRSEQREMKEFDEHMEYFEGLEMTGKRGMIDTIMLLEQDIAPRITFKKELSKQSKWVRDEYYRQLNSLDLHKNKRELLNSILKSIEGLENAPSAVQAEFVKLQKKSKETVDTKTLREQVQQKYAKLKGSYQGQIMQNIAYFGGKEVLTPSGKMPEAAWEFLEWFDDQDSFAAMEAAMHKLPKLIEKRKHIYDKRDEILSVLPEKKRDALLAKTNLMRRHELEAYLPDLEKNAQKNNLMTAEYQASLTIEKEQGFPLFTSFEQKLMLRRFALLPIDEQESRLTQLERIADERRVLVREFLELPKHIQNKYFKAFFEGDDSARAKILDDAQIQEQTEKRDPFAISSEKSLTSTDADAIAKAIEGAKGENVMEDLSEELKQEGELKAAEIQAATYDKIFGTARRAKLKKMTQEESYLDDLKYWIRLRKDVEDESDANNNKERSKFRYIEAADVAYDEGFVFTSGGQVRQLQEIDKEELETGANSENVMERLSRAKYGEHVRVVKKDQSERTLDPLEMIEDLGEAELLRLSMKLLEKLTFGTMKQSSTNAAKLRNSKSVMRAIQSRLIDEQFSHLEDREAA